MSLVCDILFLFKAFTDKQYLSQVKKKDIMSKALLRHNVKKSVTRALPYGLSFSLLNHRIANFRSKDTYIRTVDRKLTC